MAAASLPMGFEAGDVVVVGDRPDAQRMALEVGVALLVTSNGTRPGHGVLALARERGSAVVSSPLDSYVTGRMVTLSAPCQAMMDRKPLVVRPDDLVADVKEYDAAGGHTLRIAQVETVGEDLQGVAPGSWRRSTPFACATVTSWSRSWSPTSSPGGPSCIRPARTD